MGRLGNNEPVGSGRGIDLIKWWVSDVPGRLLRWLAEGIDD